MYIYCVVPAFLYELESGSAQANRAHKKFRIKINFFKPVAINVLTRKV